MAGTARQQRADRGSAQPLAPPVPDHSHQRPFFARPARLSSLVVAAGLHKLWAQSRLALPAQAHSCAPFTHSVSKSGCQPGSFQASIGGSLLASSEVNPAYKTCAYPCFPFIREKSRQHQGVSVRANSNCSDFRWLSRLSKSTEVFLTQFHL